MLAVLVKRSPTAAYKSMRIFGLAGRLRTIEGVKNADSKLIFPVRYGVPVKYTFNLRKMSLVTIPDTDTDTITTEQVLVSSTNLNM